MVSNLIARQSSENFLAAVVPAEILALTNTQRVDNDAAPLTEDTLLDNAAQAKANDMAANGYFSHIGPDGKTPWQWISGAGYQYQYAGENLAVRFIDSSDVVNAWMASPTHRANIVKPVYTETGVGVAEGLYEGQEATYVVQYFGTPLAAAPAESAPAVAQTQDVAVNAVPAHAATQVVTPPATPTSTSTPAPAAVATTAKPTLAAAQTTPSGQVEGAAVTVAPTTLAANNFNSYVQSFVRQVARAFAEPLAVSNWILGLCATILILVLVLTFFMHLQIQPTHMLMSGAFVALFALSLIGLNSRLSADGGAAPSTDLSASAVEAGVSSDVVISSDAASTGFALFPQQ